MLVRLQKLFTKLNFNPLRKSLAVILTLIKNLAAMPTKITIPVFFVSIFIDIAIIAYFVIIGFDISGTRFRRNGKFFFKRNSS